MKTTKERVLERMKPGREYTSIAIRVPVDVVEELKEIAPMLGFFSYEALLRSYIGTGLRRDEEILHCAKSETVSSEENATADPLRG